MEYVFIIAFGLIGGSFLSVLIFRLGKKDGLFLGRSECKACDSRLRWYDLVPIFSYFLLRGKCRYCNTKISLTYPALEVITAASFLLLIINRGLVLDIGTFFWLIIIFFLIAIIFFDILYYIIPDRIVFPLILLTLAYNWAYKSIEFNNMLLSGLVMGGFFAIMYVLSKGRWVGLGDAKLALLVGFLFGYPFGFWALIISIWIASIWGIMLIILRKATIKTALPFGAYLGVVSILFIIFENIIKNEFKIIYWIF
jgi:leader peptidase (prepilin peptidase) / N-methyltransferase